MLNDHRDTRRISGVTRALVFVMLLSAAAAVAAAQTTYRGFTGVVSDEQGRGVPGAAVALSNEARQAKYEIKTGADGRFDFVGLLPGDYRVSIERAGFQSVRDTLTVGAQNVQRNFTVQLGTLQETITVRADPNKPPAAEAAPSAIREVAMPAPRKCEPSAEGGQIVPPKKIRDVPPHYPPSLVSSGVQGTVMLRGRIAADGYISDISVLKEAHPELAQAAMEAVRGWRYTETLLNCVPAEPGITITTNFSLSAAP